MMAKHCTKSIMVNWCTIRWPAISVTSSLSTRVCACLCVCAIPICPLAQPDCRPLCLAAFQGGITRALNSIDYLHHTLSQCDFIVCFSFFGLWLRVQSWSLGVAGKKLMSKMCSLLVFVRTQPSSLRCGQLFSHMVSRLSHQNPW